MTDEEKKKKLEEKAKAHIRGDRQIKSRTRELWKKAVLEARAKEKESES